MNTPLGRTAQRLDALGFGVRLAGQGGGQQLLGGGVLAGRPAQPGGVAPGTPAFPKARVARVDEVAVDSFHVLLVDLANQSERASATALPDAGRLASADLARVVVLATRGHFAGQVPRVVARRDRQHLRHLPRALRRRIINT